VGNPQAQGQLERPTRRVVVDLQIGLQAIDDGFVALLSGVLEQHHEFVSPHPGDDIRAAKGFAQDVSRLHQSPIPRLMAQSVIDPLHFVKIQIDQGGVGFGAIRQLQLLLSQGKEAAAILSMGWDGKNKKGMKVAGGTYLGKYVIKDIVKGEVKREERGKLKIGIKTVK